MVLIKVQNNEAKGINVNSFSPFSFILYGDIQYGMIRKDLGWSEERDLLNKAIQKTNKLKPPFVIALGDLSNSLDFDGIQSKQYADLKEDFQKLDKSINLYVFCGNHDVMNTPTCESISNFEKTWGNSYYSFIYNKCGFIILNSPVLYNDTNVENVKINQFKWLEEILKKMDSLNVNHKFLFMHHPLIYDDINEEEDIGTIYACKIRLYLEKKLFHIPKKNRLIIYELMKKYKVDHIFCAHMHFNREVNIDSKIKQIVVSAVGMQIRDDKSGIMIVHVGEKDVDYKYYPFEYVPNLLCN